MGYLKGEVAVGRVNKITEKGVFVSLPDNEFGFIPQESISKDENGQSIVVRRGMEIQSLVTDIKGGGFYFLSQTKYEKQRTIEEQQKRKQIRTKLFEELSTNVEEGDTCECVITKILNSKYLLSWGAYDHCIVEKEEIAWGIQDERSQDYQEGQVVDAYFLRAEDDVFYFSLKRMRENPYSEEFYNLGTEDILRIIGCSKNIFCGQISKPRSSRTAILKNIIAYNNRKDDELEGELLINPFTGTNLQAIFRQSAFDELIDGKFCEVSLVIAPSQIRRERNEPFLFGVESFEIIDDDPYRNIVNEVFAKSDNPHSNTTIARLLEEVGKQLYSSKDRTFFELLQNADDAAAPKSKNAVEIVVDQEGDYLLFCHNGCSFNRTDFVSISSAANSTKRKLGNKTGFKGIGFKSVFSDAKSVHLKSGGFSVKFEKDNPLFTNFHDFYYKARRCQSDEDYRKLMFQFRDDEKSFRGVSDMPWQILPIWEEGSIFQKIGKPYNVNIAIRTQMVDAYRSSIVDLTKRPEFLLFLRNTRRLTVFGKCIEKSVSSNNVVVRSGNISQRYLKKDFDDIEINNEEFSKCDGLGLEIRDVANAATGDIEKHFFENGQDKSSTIPNKLAEAGYTIISFVIPINSEQIEKKELRNGISPIFAYLPTTDNRFDFPFFVNADFVLSSNREFVTGDNPWNIYLFSQIGDKLVRWVSELAIHGHRDYLNLLIANELNDSISETRNLARHFNISYKKAIQNIPFILNRLGKLCRQCEIVLDVTGKGNETSPKLSQILGASLFETLTDSKKHLPSFDIDDSILYQPIFSEISKVSPAIIIPLISESKIIPLWFKQARKDKQQLFIKWLIENQQEELIQKLPIFEFDGEAKSIIDVKNDSQYIVIPESLLPIKPVIEKLGLKCSVPFQSTSYYSVNQLDIFNKINDKLIQYQSIFILLGEAEEICAGVGQEEVYYSGYAKNLFSKLGESGFLTVEHRRQLQNLFPVITDEDDHQAIELSNSHYIFYELPNIIREILSSILTINDKNLLISTKIDGIAEGHIKSLPLFLSSVDEQGNGGIPTPLNEMVAFRDSAPKYLLPYMISKSEYSEELDKYLIPRQDEFDSIVWKNIDNISATPLQLIEDYGLEGDYIRGFIDRCGSREQYLELLPIIESEGEKTQKYYLNKLGKIDLSKDCLYDRRSFEYRVLNIALKTLEEPSDFSKQVFLDGKCIASYSIADKVVCTNGQNESRAVFSLSKLLPHYKDQSEGIEIFKSLFEPKMGLEKFFAAQNKNEAEIVNELNELLKIPLAGFSLWKSGTGNPQQYLFSTYIRRKKGWDNRYVPSISLEDETDEFIFELMDFLRDNNINIKSSPYTYHLSTYFEGKYWRNNYSTQSECILKIIEKWAVSDKERNYKYLIDKGAVRSESHPLIVYRKDFLENNQIKTNPITTHKEAVDFLTFLSVKDGLCKPFLANNQSSILFDLQERFGNNIPKLQKRIDIDALHKQSKELDSDSYISWRQNRNLSLFFVKGEIPWLLAYDGSPLTYGNFDDYYYSRGENIIYLNSDRDFGKLMLKIVGEGNSDVDLVDYQRLCIDGKVLLNQEDIDEKEKTIVNLKDENERLRKELEKYKHQFENNESPIIGRGDENGLSTEAQIEAQIEAQKFLISYMPQWTFPLDYGTREGNYYTICDDIYDENEGNVIIVLKSHKSQGEPLHITPNEWDAIMSGAKLFIYTVKWNKPDIVEIDSRDLIMNQSNISLTFSTENLDIEKYEERVSALSKSLHYFTGMTFDFESFNLSAKATSIKELYNKVEGKQNEFSDEEVL